MTPQSGTVNPMNPHNVVADSMNAEYRYLILKPIRSRLIGEFSSSGADQQLHVANFSFELKDVANAYLARKQSSEFSGDNVGYCSLLFLIVFTEANQTCTVHSARHLLWHAK
jgi:hypothetical protein